MKDSTQERELYHPRIDGSGRPQRGQRNSWARLRLIQSKLNFAGQTVLDLGCSGGFFALSIARQAKHVVAVDADLHIIEKNRREAERLGLENIEFVHANINQEFVTSLGSFDIVLFLSVFHHILATSDSYDWNGSSDAQNALRLLTSIRQLGKTYVFEMGEAWEPRYDWADRIAAKIGNASEWIPSHVFGPDYTSIEVLAGVAYQRWPFTWWPGLARLACGTRIGRTLLRQSGINRSDFRTLYIGRKRD